jgi:hypothetical protein
MLKEVASILCVTELDDAVLSDVHLARERNPQAVLDRWLAESPRDPILVFHDASKLAVYAASPEAAPRA